MKSILSKLRLDNYTINIIAWNLVPYWGVFFLKWEPLTVFVCYALESVVIGIFNVFKLIVVYFSGNTQEEEANPNQLGIFAIPAFIFSYGLLAFCQLCIFFSFTDFVIFGDERHELNIKNSLAMIMGDHALYLAFSVFFLSNAILFIHDFILNKEYAHRSMREQMTEPFPLVMGSQFVVLIGLYLYLAFGDSILLLFALTAVKVVTELILKRHKAYEIFA